MCSFEHTGSNVHADLGQAIGATAHRGTGVVVGDSYLLRSILSREHDLLAAFTVVDVTPGSLILVGRVLRTWPIRGERDATSPRVDWSTADAPPWLLAMDDESLYALQRRLQETLGARLLAVPASPGTATDSGVVRLLQRGRYAGLTRVRGDGAYFSFVTRSHSYDDEPDLEWQQDNFCSGFYGGNTGAFVDLGDVPLADVSIAQLPSPLVPQSPSPTEVGDCEDRVRVKLNNTYALRSVLEDEHDVLAAFRPIAQDDHGMTIEWRLLQRYD
jgi:hypothetical protein